MSKFKINIVKSVIDKLKTLKEGAFGTLLTTTEAENVGFTVLGVVVTNTGGDDGTPIDSDLAELHYPKGAWLGSFMITDDDQTNKMDNVLVLNVNPKSHEVIAFYEDERNYPIHLIEEAQAAREHFMVRSRLTLPVCCELSETGISTMIENLREKLYDIKIAELDGIPMDIPYQTPGSKKNFQSTKDMEVIEMTPLMLVSPEEDSDTLVGVRIDHTRGAKKCCWFDLTVDALAIIPRCEPALFLAESLSSNLRQMLALHENCLLTQLKSGKTPGIPETFHFLPQSAAHFLSVVYPRNVLDSDLGEYRRFLHRAFVLPMDRPLLMRSNAYVFGGGEEEQSALKCPHSDLKQSPVTEGEAALVQGSYLYYHYCQQGEDDNGWGCAYRSLQTLCSWFKLQGYTTKSVPSIKEIQQCLVRIGDKPSSFVGSRQWIGSTEVGFCLDTLLGVTSRIVSVSSGDELSMKGGELSHHFNTQGTPVMIGGGNLAHTILGVDYNKKTGDIKFLILDPHYTGSDDLSTILSKGWCGWKGANFWKTGCFYNMCMPVKPSCI